MEYFTLHRIQLWFLIYNRLEICKSSTNYKIPSSFSFIESLVIHFEILVLCTDLFFSKKHTEVNISNICLSIFVKLNLKAISFFVVPNWRNAVFSKWNFFCWMCRFTNIFYSLLSLLWLILYLVVAILDVWVLLS